MGIRMRSNPDSGYPSDDESLDYPSELDSQPRADTAPQGNGGSVFSLDVLKIEICGPSVDYLTVIDVPGIFRTPTEGITTKADMAMVTNMVRWYIQDSRTVILAVLPSNVDVSTQEILTMAEEYDKDGERTLGILTKPDLVREPSAQAAVCNIVRGKKKQLTLGYYLVRSRGADQGDADFQDREALFNEAPWNTLPADRVGVRALKARLAELLGEMARREFSGLRKDIGTMLRGTETLLTTLGPSRRDEHEQRRFLSGIAGRFQTRVRQALEAQYAGDGVFENSIDLRLVTQVVHLADAFSEEFEEKSMVRRFEEIGESDETEGGEKVKDPTADRILQFARDIDAEDFPELEGIVSYEYQTHEPDDDIMEWIGGLYGQSRGMDLGTFSSAVWTGAWREQSSKWPLMSTSFVSRVILVIHRFIDAALEDVCADPGVRRELRSAILDEVLARYKGGMEAAEFLASTERDGKPYTLDHRFNAIRQQSRGQRIAERLENLEDDFGNIKIDQVRNVTEEQSNAEEVVEKMHDDLRAYYDIARKRFVDNVLNQAVNYRLLFGPSTPLGVLSQEWVIGLRAEELESIAGESPRIREQRERLTQKIADLKAAKDILRS